MIMKSLLLFFILGVASVCACNNGTNSQQETKRIVDKENKSLFSTRLLSGTSWLADFSDKVDSYRISFTDTTYVTKISYASSKRTYVETYFYYLSNVKPRQFDMSKVGKETKGDIIVMYKEHSKKKKTTADKLLFISPQKLIILLNEVDTLTFTRE